MHFEKCIHVCSQEPSQHVGHFHHLESSLMPLSSHSPSPTRGKPWCIWCLFYTRLILGEETGDYRVGL